MECNRFVSFCELWPQYELFFKFGFFAFARRWGGVTRSNLKEQIWIRFDIANADHGMMSLMIHITRPTWTMGLKVQFTGPPLPRWILDIHSQSRCCVLHVLSLTVKPKFFFPREVRLPSTRSQEAPWCTKTDPPANRPYHFIVPYHSIGNTLHSHLKVKQASQQIHKEPLGSRYSIFQNWLFSYVNLRSC